MTEVHKINVYREKTFGERGRDRNRNKETETEKETERDKSEVFDKLYLSRIKI